MNQFERLLVGIDISLDGDAITEGSRRAALQAQWLAQRIGASITFLHSTWTDLYEDTGTIRQGPSPAGEKALAEFLAGYQESGVPVELVTVEERAWIEMIRRVLRGQNDFVFIGRRNSPGSSALGSTARKLIRKCPAPVWAVNPSSELVHEAVLAATDLTPVGELAVELGAYVAKACGGELHVVHAWQVPFEAQFQSEGDQEDRLGGIQEECERRIRTALGEEDPDLTVELHVGCDAPSRAIERGIEALGAELLVMGTISRGGIAGFLIGNTAERLLDRVACSLLTIKPEDFVSPVEAD